AFPFVSGTGAAGAVFYTLSLHDALPIFLCFGGDAAHYDSLKPVTPRSRHVLNADGDARDMADAVLDVAVHAIDEGLRTHEEVHVDRKSTRLNSSHVKISYAVFCLKKKMQ